MRKFPWLDFLVILILAAVGRALLLASGALSFHSDEAVVALMARHINQGANPVFFYGQAYMGSLDAYLVAVGFRLFGESVLSIRLVQSGLYLLVVATAYRVGWQFSGRRLIAAVTGLLLALPAVNTALYTTVTLGGYNETLLLGNLILLLGYGAVHAESRSSWRWMALGLVAGLGWWTNGLIIMLAAPTGLILLIVWIRRRTPIREMIPALGLVLLGFFVGSAPWWVFDFTHQHAALSTYLMSQQTGEFAGIGIPYIPPSQRALGFLIIGLPTLVGLRFPWSSAYFLLPVGVLVVLTYALALYRLVRGHNPLRPEARLLVLLIPGLFTIIFIASTFGADPTGRYFLPLVVPLGIIFGTLVDDLASRVVSPGSRAAAVMLVALVIGYQAAGQSAAIQSPTGLTPQFDLISHIPNDHDDELIAFLLDHNLRQGYTNYWVAFRLAFLSGEQLTYSASLPYKADLSYNRADNRYPPYAQATAASDSIAYITTRLPALDQRLEAAFEARGIAYEKAVIGDFHVYYGFPTTPHLTLADL
ncbi:MAG: glycosyltransferase family 39 protein [Anaerolineae bacterium]|nr:glycosyltransferase family 39 protein [Anaerolineae bacterium]